MTYTEIKKALETLNLYDKNVCIHSSMRSFKNRSENSCKILLDSFLDNDCTVLVPTFSDEYEVHPVKKFMPKQNGAGDYSYFYSQKVKKIPPFTTDSKEISVEDMGVFQKFVLNQVDSFRGNNPLNSFTAVGKNAAKMVENQSVTDVYAPLKFLCDNDGYLVLVGVKLDHATLIHYAEQLSGRNLFVRWAKNSDNKTIGVNVGSCSSGFNSLEPALEKIKTTITVDGSVWQVFNAKDFVDICVNEIKKNPMITHCGDNNCDRCNDATKGGPFY